MLSAPRQLRRRSVPDPQALVASGLHPVLARAYSARGVSKPEELDLALARLIPPDKLLHADAAAALLAQAMADQRRILLVGDFDADGATSCALGMRALRLMGAAQVDYLVPNRFDYGYGLSPEVVELALQRQPDVIVTVDNGISSIDGVAAAKAAGIAVLVTDHHLPGDELPAADVIVNPNQPGCAFPSKHLAGVGVIFYVMLALRSLLRDTGWFAQQGLAVPHLGQCLDLVALGTVADVVSLDYNNRVLVHAGLRRMQAGHACAGINALLAVAGREPQRVVAADLGYAVGPRLNAAGRLDDMSLGIACLLSDSPKEAVRYASQLDQLNRDRRLIEQDMQEEALRLLARTAVDFSAAPPALAIYEPGWHQGVIGILASRIKERAYRPVVAFADADDGWLKGSARSIPGVHMRDILATLNARHPNLMGKFGGHAMAAGLSLKRDHLPAFTEALQEEVKAQTRELDLQSVLDSDGALAPEELHIDLARDLRSAGPWGQHFPEPLFDGCFAVVSQRLVGERHLKLVLAAPGTDVLLDAIAFNIDLSEWPDEGQRSVEIAYRMDVNAFRGQESLQLIVEQISKP